MDTRVYKEIRHHRNCSVKTFIGNESLENFLSSSELKYIGGLFEEASIFYDMGMDKAGDHIWDEIRDMIEARKYESKVDKAFYA